MAMAVAGKNRHYRWYQIRRSHWEETAARCGLGTDVRALIDALVEQTPMVVDEVRKVIPRGFPSRVAEPVLKGLAASAKRLGKQGR
jgi:serine/threonine-protein kinase HipA